MTMTKQKKRRMFKMPKIILRENLFLQTTLKANNNNNDSRQINFLKILAQMQNQKRTESLHNSKVSP